MGPPSRLAVATAMIAAAIVLPPLAGGATPIPSDGATSLPAFRGSAAGPRPIRHVPLPPRNPFMARNGNSNVHNDT